MGVIADVLKVIVIWAAIVSIVFLVTKCLKESPDMQPKTAFQECISRCPTDFNENFKTLECPMMCKNLLVNESNSCNCT